MMTSNRNSEIECLNMDDLDVTFIECMKIDLARQLMSATLLTTWNFRNITNNTVQLILIVLSNSLLVEYPLKTEYLAKLFKEIIKQNENNKHVTCDGLYLKYVELINKNPGEGLIERPFYKHYVVADSDDFDKQIIPSAITIQESTSIVSHGTTGLCTWQAGVALSIWCWKNKDKLEDKFIIELGCGIGLSGISACMNCKPREYWFTDCHSSVLNVLRRNIQINESRKKFNCKYDILQLSWDAVEDVRRFDEEKPDLVLAADVVFDQEMFHSLCNCLKYLTNKNATEAFLFCTIRNPKTYYKFLKTLDDYNMIYTQEILPVNYSVILPQDCPICILNVKQKL